MLEIISKLKWCFKTKPSILMEEDSYWHLNNSIQFKMFAKEHIGLGILFIIFQELDNEELYLAGNGVYTPRYSHFKNSSNWCWSVDLVCYGLEKALEKYNSNLRFKRRFEARELFYLTFGEELGSEFTNEPQVGHIVLFPNLSKKEPKIGIVSRTLKDRLGRVKKWWYIAGNEGAFVAKVKESRGDNKKVEGFMDVSKVKW